MAVEVGREATYVFIVVKTDSRTFPVPRTVSECTGIRTFSWMSEVRNKFLSDSSRRHLTPILIIYGILITTENNAWYCGPNKPDWVKFAGKNLNQVVSFWILSTLLNTSMMFQSFSSIVFFHEAQSIIDHSPVCLREYHRFVFKRLCEITPHCNLQYRHRREKRSAGTSESGANSEISVTVEIIIIYLWGNCLCSLIIRAVGFSRCTENYGGLRTTLCRGLEEETLFPFIRSQW